MLNRFRDRDPPFPETAGMLRTFCTDGLVFGRSEENLPTGSMDPKRIDSAGVEGLLAQLDDDGLTVALGDVIQVPWDHVFELLENPHYPGCRSILGLPEDRGYVPALESYHTLTDRDFAIAVAGWYDAAGGRVRDLQVCGAIAKNKTGFGLLSRQVWETLSHISRFQRRPDTERDHVSQRRQWGKIRRLAISAGAQLDSFLFRGVVLTPEKLDIRLRSNEAGGKRIVEVIPTFHDAPETWLDEFDQRRDVPDLYNIPSANGDIQVLISPPVKTVLENIKRLHGRRVAGVRAEAFLINPYAALGEAASETIEEAQFLAARAEAGLLFERFVAHIERDALGYPFQIGLHIEAAKAAEQIESEIRAFADDNELEQFISEIESALSAGRQLCGWQGYDFELLGETPRELDLLRQALKAHREPPMLVSYATIYDLSLYSSRIENIGAEKAYYSPFIARKRKRKAGFPIISFP